MKSPLLAAATVAASCLITSDLSGQLSVSSGIGSQNHPVTGGLFVGGLDALENGNLVVFDGTSIVEMDGTSGANIKTLFSPPGFVFGSFVKVDPTGSYLLFGESSNQDIWKVPLDGSTPKVVANILYNYDCVFAAPDVAFISHANSGWATSEVVLLDVAQSTVDLIATVPGPSGPLAIDSEGRLHYGQSDAPGSGAILYWSTAQLGSAVGPTHLTELDAAVFIGGLGTISALLFDNQGDVLVSDSVDGVLEEYRFNGALLRQLASVPMFSSITYLAIVDRGLADEAVFEPFQPPSGGAIAAISSDWSTLTEVNILRPKRVGFETSPLAPVPVGNFSLDLNDGPESGHLILLLAAPPMFPQYTVYTLDVPFFFELEPQSTLIAAPVQLDGSGGLSFSGTNPGWGSTVQVQGALFDASYTPLGSTEALTLVLQ